ncbi:MAG: primosomal protein N', partial [Thermosulfidibacteraceae bacterium]
MFVEVVFPLAFDKPLLYRCNFGKPLPGCRVVAPLKGKSKIGFVYNTASGIPEGDFEIKEIEKILDEGPIIPEDVLILIRRISDYY